jgi:predicted Zn-dependent protease
MNMVRALAASACLFSVSAPAAQAQFRLVSEQQELEAGRQADAELRQKYRVSTDRDLNNLVSHLGRRMAQVSERPNLQWTFRVLDSNELNAFSVPGFVYITTATIRAAGRDQDMLAGVIGHEIAHTTGKHAVNQMEKGAIGGLLVGLIGGKNKTVGSLAGVATNLLMLGYSRNDEYDSDRRAVRYMLKSGYDPNGLVRFFQFLQSQGDKGGGGGLATYFRTHPQTNDRIKRTQEEIKKQGGQVRSSSGDSYREDRYREEREPVYEDSRERREGRRRNQERPRRTQWPDW